MTEKWLTPKSADGKRGWQKTGKQKSATRLKPSEKWQRGLAKNSESKIMQNHGNRGVRRTEQILNSCLSVRKPHSDCKLAWDSTFYLKLQNAYHDVAPSRSSIPLTPSLHGDPTFGDLANGVYEIEHHSNSTDIEPEIVLVANASQPSSLSPRSTSSQANVPKPLPISGTNCHKRRDVSLDEYFHALHDLQSSLPQW